MADMDLYGIAINPIGQYSPFTGAFNGNGHIIKNVTIAQPNNSFIGLFSHVGEGGVITDLAIEKCNTAGLDYVGGLAGYNDGGIISKCSAAGNIDAAGDYAGGLVGENHSGTINNSYSSGSVTAARYGGGLVGYNAFSGSISKCYSTGAASASAYGRGFAGYNAAVNGITNSFWDSETSGQTAGTEPVSSGVTGKTTSQMQDIGTFTAAGWDYGLVWKQVAGTYPILKWQTFAADLNGDGLIDVEDILIIAENWLEQGQGLQADINGDGFVDLLDYATLAQQGQN